MSLATIILLALALAMDAFAVSISSGITICKMKLRHALRIAAFFGFFQAAMPIAGWCAGRMAASLIKCVDHWIAFVLLSFIGVKMIYESVAHKDEKDSKFDPLNIYILFSLAIATSIDAAAVGAYNRARAHNRSGHLFRVACRNVDRVQMRRPLRRKNRDRGRGRSDRNRHENSHRTPVFRIVVLT